MKRIGWIWLGVMGEPMAKNILHAGYELRVYNRTSEKTKSLIELGAKKCESIQDIVENSDIIFTIIWDPQSVENMYFWESGILQYAKSWQILVDMTTTKPSLAVEIYKQSLNKSLNSLDAPVSGWDVWAIWGMLSIMVWWDEAIFEQVYPLFEILGKTIIYTWKAGNGQHTKMANQISIAWNTIALCESLVYAEKIQLDIEKTIQVISTWAGGSWGWTNLAPRIHKWELHTCFFIKHFVKDMRITLDECQQLNITLPGLALVHQLYSSLLAHGDGDLWTQALIKILRKLNNI